MNDLSIIPGDTLDEAVVAEVVVAVILAAPPRGKVAAATTFAVPTFSESRFKGWKGEHTFVAFDGSTSRNRHMMVQTKALQRGLHRVAEAADAMVTAYF